MTLSFWIISGLVIGICGFIFTKTVSNDVKNDFKLRDILSKSDDDDILPTTRGEYKTEEKERVVAGYSKPESESEHQYSKDYSTNSYSTKTHEIEQDKQASSEDIFYEKIDDEACEDYVPEEDSSDFEETTRKDYNDNYSNQKSDTHKYSTNFTREFTSEFEEKENKSGTNLFYFVKTFWRGITFSIGLLVTIYSFMGLAYQVQTSNDAIIYSIWLLIGVILIK